MTGHEGQGDVSSSRSYPYFSETLQEETGALKFLTPYPTALREISVRSEDAELKKRVEEYLGGDIPEYFGEKPILYLARHVATPNFETLRFMHLLEPLEFPIVISQDAKDIFTSANPLKKALCKLPICTRITFKDGSVSEHYQNATIVDFATSQSKPFNTIATTWGENLVAFHTRLFRSLSKVDPHIVDDSLWIDRNHRGDLLEHYKRFLALFIAHGVLFEDYLVEDEEEEHFVREILEPAYTFIEEYFGVKPLITQLVPSSVESAHFWLSYPREVLDILTETKKTV